MLLLVICAVSCATVPESSYKQWRPHVYTSTALDAGTTLYGLHHGLVEANPIMAPLTKNNAVFVAAQFGFAYLVDRVTASTCRKHPDNMRCMVAMKALVVVKYAAGAWNLYQVTK